MRTRVTYHKIMGPPFLVGLENGMGVRGRGNNTMYEMLKPDTPAARLAATLTYEVVMSLVFSL
jgi:hypothetical protein